MINAGRQDVFNNWQKDRYYALPSYATYHQAA